MYVCLSFRYGRSDKLTDNKHMHAIDAKPKRRRKSAAIEWKPNRNADERREKKNQRMWKDEKKRKREREQHEI